MSNNERTPHSPEHINRLNSFMNRVLDHAKNYPELEIYPQDALKKYSDACMMLITVMLGKDESGVNMLLKKVALSDSKRMKQAISTVIISGDDYSNIEKVSAELVEISKEYGGKTSTASEITDPLTTEDFIHILDDMQKLTSTEGGESVSDRTFDMPHTTFIKFTFE